ncbi:hypothetical protein BS78_09G254700 [Paspalum vaginatum]|nr:hypothetical protein BS78_09G254700 [Paspalum vaginatum]
MSTSRQADDEPAVLQLCRWRLSQPQLKLSEFREAFISPTRQLFGLLSDHGDLVLARAEVNPSQVESTRALSDTCTQAIFETFSSIPRVKSLAWGYCSDASSPLEDSSFNEILVVSSHASITVHAFCCSRKSTLAVNSTSDAKELHGEWKEWRPTEYSVSEGGESGPKNWFCSFLTTITASVSSGKYQARFPMKSLLPHTAEAVSFSIYDITLSFLKFWYSKCPQKTMMETSSESPQSFLSSLPVAEASCSCQWECLKVLSSSSGYVIGLVLTPNESVTCAAHQCNTECILVAVLELNQWGIQWNFVADLQDVHDSIKPSPKWVDFQLSDTFLACLSTEGFVAIWDVKTGGLATSFSVLQKCRTNREMPLSSISPVTNLDGGNISVEDSVGRMFKRLVLASYSHILAVVDEVGVVYMFYADDILNFKANVHENFDLFVMDRFGDCFSAWEAAGHDIGSRSFCTNQSIQQGSLHPAKLVPEFSGKTDAGIRPRKRRKRRCNENEVDSGRSGFVTTGQMKVGVPCPSSVNSSSSLRRILLPPCRSQQEVISLSPLGLMRISKGSIADGNGHVKIFHSELFMYSSILVERDINAGFVDKRLPFKKHYAFAGDSIVCSCQGYLYLITQCGLSVVLPPVSISSFSSHGDAIKFWQPGFAGGGTCDALNLLSVDRSETIWKSWQIEVLDRALLYEGPALADRLCRENGWDLKVSRLRWLQLALHYSMIGDLEQSLNMLAEVNLAEEGVLQLLLASIHRLSSRTGSDNEVSVSSKLMVLAVRFATRMIKCYGIQKQNTDMPDNSVKLHEMASLLMVIRSIQSRLSAKSQNSVQMGDDRSSLKVGTEVYRNDYDSSLPVVVVDGVSSGPSVGLDAHDRHESAHVLVPGSNHMLALTPVESSLSPPLTVHDIDTNKGAAQDARQIIQGNIKEMINRWEMSNFDLKTVVREALQSGRLPLAVLQLQLLRQRELISNEDSEDAFSEVHEIGRSIVYDLLMKGETGLAVATLERLGDDVESDLRQLMQGTVRRSLRLQIADEMKKRGYIRSDEWKMLETITLIERFYPSSSFWDTYFGRENVIRDAAKIVTLPGEDKPVLALHICNRPFIECGDVDGAVLDSWVNINDYTGSKEFSGSNISGGYWACAAVWSDAWDQRTVDRILLDQPYHIQAHIPWESQFDYFVGHNDVGEVCKLLDIIPNSVLLEGIIRVNVDSLQAAENTVSDLTVSDYSTYICDSEELEPVCMEIPHVKVFRPLYNHESTLYVRMLMQQELAKKHIFMKEDWQSTTEIIPLLARAGILIKVSPKKECSTPFCASEMPDDAHLRGRQGALHKLIIRFCVQYNLPHLLELYLDNCNLAPEKDCIPLLKDAAGDCKWAQWLLFSRIKGYEYEASFSNACWNLSQKMLNSSKLADIGIDEMLYTVDDMAERIGEMSALSTLMYASAPIQKSICTGSVNRSRGLSSQCTLENLGPCLQQFPTLWKTLVSACFGQDEYGSVSRKSSVSEYLHWRYSIFSSAGRDTSLLQMLPCWVPKSIRRLIQLFEQGPFGMQLLSSAPSSELFIHNVTDYIYNSTGYTEANALSLEASIQKSVEEVLYSSLEEKDVRVEHHLHRGRALAAFRHLIFKRASQLKSASARQVISSQSNVQADVQLILAPLSQAERSILLSVAPLAITNFEDSTLVASCIFLLELCGLCANMLRLDIAALRRISSYYKSYQLQQNNKFDLLSPRAPELHVQSHGADIAPALARALAEDYVQSDHLHVLEHNQTSVAPKRTPKREQTPQPLIAILQHLEKASLPSLEEGKTCGFWLLTGVGNASLYRSQQNEASQRWNLVTEFCQAHHLPQSTKYLALLANDNDWVGFLTEAHIAGFPIEVVVEVGAKEIRDSRLRTHILTVLKNMMSLRRKSSGIIPSGSSDSSFSAVDGNNPMELFCILGVCEKQKNPGEALLNKAKQMQWSLLAMIASCFSDVTPLSCLSVWLEITAAREMSSSKVDDISSKIAKNVGSAVEATNKLPSTSRNVELRYNRKNPKRRRFLEASPEKFEICFSLDNTCGPNSAATSNITYIDAHQEKGKPISGETIMSVDTDERLASLSSMVAVLCEQQLFLPLLRAFEMFLPSCSLLSFIRSLQAFSQMRLSEASAHLASFSVRIKDEASHAQVNSSKEVSVIAGWVAVIAVKAADAVLSTCPSIYEKRCLLQLLSAVDFADGGTSSSYFSKRYWKINLSEPSLYKDGDIYNWNDLMDDDSLLTSLEKDGRWEEARTWARQLESSDIAWESTLDHVTESQAEAMVAEWKEFLWDIPQERAALWGHCQSLFMKYSFPPLKAGLFFLKHAEAIGKEIPARELHEILLLSLQWLSGTMTKSSPVYPLHLLREIETRVWLLAVESESQSNADGEFATSAVAHNIAVGNSTSIIEQTADIITKIDCNMSSPHMKPTERNGMRDNISCQHVQLFESNSEASSGTTNNTRAKRRVKTNLPLRRGVHDHFESRTNDVDNSSNTFHSSKIGEQARHLLSEEEFAKMEASLSGWEQNVRPVDMEKAVLSLLEFGQITAAKQLQQKLSPSYIPEELVLVDLALRIANNSSNGEISLSFFDRGALLILQSLGVASSSDMIDPSQVMERLAVKCGEGRGRALIRRITAVIRTAKLLGLPFSEAFEKQPIELLQLLSLKAQDSFDEAKFLVDTHTMPASSIARILADSFLKGLLAAHRGGYLDSQKEEGPAPLLWRSSDFLKWAKLCPSEPEIGHALMRLVMTGHEVPHACEVELLILSHHFYMSSSCLDGVDVLVTFAANRVDSYVLEGDFSCLARLITGVSNFHSLSFILSILVENGQLELLLQKYSATDTATGTPASVRGFRMAVITSLKQFNPNDDDALSMVYRHFDMKHEAASLLELRAEQCMNNWLSRYDKERRNDELLEAMHHLVETAEVLSTIDAGQRTHRACARASLLSLQIRIPDLLWIGLSETNARRIFVEQSRFQEALIVAEAYNINQPTEWAPVFWNQMLKPDIIEQFVAEFVSVLPLHPPMLLELARFYRAEVAARGEQSHFSVWLSPGGLPAEWVKHLGRSFRSLLRRTRDMRLRLQLATLATGFIDVLDICNRVLDKVPENAGPLILRRGHGGAYIPLM